MRAYIFDLDGTICNIDHRLHYIRDPAKTKNGTLAPPPGTPEWPGPRWDAFFAACVGDKPIAAICGLLADLSRSAAIVYSTGRSDAVRDQTRMWIENNVGGRGARAGKLYMRRDKDHRPDYVVKSELLDQILADGYQPIMAFEDRDQVVKMYRERGIACCQVAEGNF